MILWQPGKSYLPFQILNNFLQMPWPKCRPIEVSRKNSSNKQIIVILTKLIQIPFLGSLLSLYTSGVRFTNFKTLLEEKTVIVEIDEYQLWTYMTYIFYQI